MKKLFYLLSFLLFPTFSFAQERKVVNDPGFKSKIQGVWADVSPGKSWIKVVISGDRYYYYSARPSSGEWIDMTNMHKNNVLTDFVKITTRDDYNGKLMTYSVAYTDNDQNGLYTSFRIDVENGQQYLTMVRKGDKPNYSSSSGRNMNEPVVISNLKKRASNFNPWSN